MPTAHKLLIRELKDWGDVTLFGLADKNKLKNFTEHTCCQTKLNEIWHGGMSVYTPWWKIVLCIFLPILMPLIISFSSPLKICCDDRNTTGQQTAAEGNQLELAQSNTTRQVSQESQNQEDKDRHEVYMVNCFKPSTSFAACYFFYTAPVTKLYCNILAYIAFLGIFSYSILVDFKYDDLSTIEMVTFFWMASMFLEEIRQIIPRRLTAFRHHSWKNYWNFLDLIMYFMFFASFILRIALNKSNFVAARIMYSITLLMFYFRSLQFFYAVKHIGPKVVIIGKMLKDLVSFMFILLIFLIGFGVAYQINLYPNSPPSWTILKNVFYLPFWQIHGEFFLEHIEGNANDQCSRNETIWKDDLDKRCPEQNGLVPALLALYTLVTNVMLLNLLIAMFSAAFQRVEDVSLKVWCYNRLSLVYEYCDRPTLIPPFIIINHIFRLMNLCRKCTCKHRPCTHQSRFDEDSPFIMKATEDENRRMNILESSAVEHSFIQRRLKEQEQTESRVSSMAGRVELVAAELKQLQTNVNLKFAKIQDMFEPGSRNVQEKNPGFRDLANQVTDVNKRLTEMMEANKQTNERLENKINQLTRLLSQRTQEAGTPS